jgi:hypothetical protein
MMRDLRSGRSFCALLRLDRAIPPHLGDSAPQRFGTCYRFHRCAVASYAAVRDARRGDGAPASSGPAVTPLGDAGSRALLCLSWFHVTGPIHGDVASGQIAEKRAKATSRRPVGAHLAPQGSGYGQLWLSDDASNSVPSLRIVRWGRLQRESVTRGCSGCAELRPHHMDSTGRRYARHT